MNTLGRQAQRSSAAVQHQRQYQDNLIDAPNKWLQSGNYQQDYGLFGAGEGGGIGSKWNRNLQKNLNGGNELSLDPSVQPFTRASTSSNQQNVDEGVSPNQYSPGLLDLHSFDTEFISEMPVRSPSGKQSLLSRGCEDAEPTDRNDPKARAFLENNLLRTTLSDKDRMTSVAKIKVVVRKRPLNKKEMSRKEGDIISIDPNSSALTVHETKYKVDLTEYLEKHEFVFDAVLNEYVTNDEVYAKTVEPIVPLIFQRTKATCFAYGQTGSGKTYTMQPLPLRASQDILSLMHHNFRNQGFQLYVGFFEIYGGKLFDLLNDRKSLFMREDGKKQVCIVGLQEYKVFDTTTIRDLIDKGNASRSTGTTGANEESSRSHAILQLAIKRSPDGNESKPPRVVGKLSFIDLAGSERGADTTDNDKQTRMEGAEINKSLLALKECIRALDNDQNHIPFRGSKLTEVLRDSFMGNSRTVMISCISPNSGSCEHTLNTLRYADRVKSLSKGSSSRRDQPSLTSIVRESSTMPLSTGSASILNTEDSSSDGPNGSGRFGWPRDTREPSPSIIDRVPSGRADGNFGYSDLYKGQKVGKGGDTEDDLEYYLENLEAEKPIWTTRNKKADSYTMAGTDERMKRNELQTRQWDRNGLNNADYTKSHDDFNDLLKEEEDLVDAHRRLVEETIEIVREEMNLLVEIEQPGNQLDDYIFKLNTYLSQKASGIMQLQNRLANFKRHLNDHNVLVSSSSGR